MRVRRGAVLIGMAVILTGCQFWQQSAEDQRAGNATAEVESHLADAKRELGDVDYGDAAALMHHVRNLTKQLFSTGNYTKEEVTEIKMALRDAERALGAANSSRERKRAVDAFVDAVEAI